MSRRSDPGRQGVVLVLVLIFLLSLTGLVLATLTTTSKGALETATLPPEYEADLLAESALAMAVNILGQDADPNSDAPQEPWAKPYRSDDLTITIIPANAYLDINDLKAPPAKNSTSDKSKNANQENKKEDSFSASSSSQNSFAASSEELAPSKDPAAEKAALKEHFRTELAVAALLREVPDNTLLAENARDWIHNSTSALKKIPLYAQKQPPAFPRYKNMLRPEELLLVAGWERIPPAFVRNRFTVWSGGSKVNLNFAPMEVLQALIPELDRYLDGIQLWREQRGFTHISQLLSATSMGSGSSEYNAALNCLTVSSDVFQVLVEARAAGCLIRKRYVLGRNPLRPDDKPALLAVDRLEALLDLR
jgi:type II secretory pathway component PulK